MCPYDAPKYNKALGIVRKCDMCSSRLEHNEAPACAQACPNQAIAIRVVERETVVESAGSGGFLPGAPTADHTLPTTVYKTKRPLQRNLLPADYYRTSLQHSHPALVIMLTFTQLAVGAFCLTYVAEHWLGHAPGSPLVQSLAATSLAFLALGASIFHLGRPIYAWRVFLGLRTSWLSREAVGFGLFALLATLYGALEFVQLIGPPDTFANAAETVRLLAMGAGVISVLCSVMVYVATRRAHWSATQTGVRFFGTTLILGSSLVLALYLFAGGGIDRIGAPFLELILFSTVAKAALEASAFAHYGTQGFSAMKRVAVLMLGELAPVTAARFGLAVCGGILIPLMLLQGVLAEHLRETGLLLLCVLVASELLERYLFFRAAPGSRMPGGLR
jgi:DMSO reductase anchor subunit